VFLAVFSPGRLDAPPCRCPFSLSGKSLAGDFLRAVDCFPPCYSYPVFHPLQLLPRITFRPFPCIPGRMVTNLGKPTATNSTPPAPRIFFFSHLPPSPLTLFLYCRFFLALTGRLINRAASFLPSIAPAPLSPPVLPRLRPVLAFPFPPHVFCFNLTHFSQILDTRQWFSAFHSRFFFSSSSGVCCAESL